MNPKGIALSEEDNIRYQTRLPAADDGSVGALLRPDIKLIKHLVIDRPTTFQFDPAFTLVVSMDGKPFAEIFSIINLQYIVFHKKCLFAFLSMVSYLLARLSHIE